MRRIAVDVREALSERPTGKGQWVRGFLRELALRNIPLILIGHEETNVPWSSPSVEFLGFPRGMRWHIRTARKLLGMRGEVLYFSPTSFIVPFLVGGSVPTVPLVHDLIAFRDEPHDRKARWIERMTLRRAMKYAKRICCISSATKQDLIHRFPFLKDDDVTPIFAGPFSPAPPLNRPDGKTILCVGTLCPRKNQLRLIKSFSLLPENIRKQFTLVLAGGRGWNDEEIVRLAKETPGVEWKGYVSDAEYENLLATCTVFAFPSLYEGFGMPVLDALQRGIPVLTSKRGSLPEVAGNAALYAEPEDTMSICDGLNTLLSDKGIRSSLSNSGLSQALQFSWKRTVDLFLSALQEEL